MRISVSFSLNLRFSANSVLRKVWERVFVVARRIIKVLRDKQKLIIGNPDLKFASVNKRLFSENWGAVMTLLQLLVDSELADLDKLRAFDGEMFFSGTGTRFLKQLVALSAKDPNDPFRKGFDAKVRLVKIDGTEATIGLMMSGTFVMTQQAVDEKPNETQMKVHQVDGVWIVEEFDYGLTKLYVDGRAMVAAIPNDAIRDNRGPLIKLLETVEEDLGRVELAKTRKELTQALVLAQLRVSQLLSAGTQEETGTETTGDSAPRGRTVTVVVKGEMDKATRQQVLGRLESLKRPGGTPRVIDGKGLVTIIIPTDQFLQDVVDAIDFGLVDAVDEVERLGLRPRAQRATYYPWGARGPGADHSPAGRGRGSGGARRLDSRASKTSENSEEVRSQTSEAIRHVTPFNAATLMVSPSAPTCSSSVRISGPR